MKKSINNFLKENKITLLSDNQQETINGGDGDLLDGIYWEAHKDGNIIINDIMEV